jgi:RES domain-containing protein
MVTIEAPDDFVAIDKRLLPKNWQDHPDLDMLKQLGNAFLLGKKNLLFKVPSAIVNEEYNYLLNPLHAGASKLKVKNIQPFNFDNRLIGE